MADPDWNDPCAVATYLQPLLAKVAAGDTIINIRRGQNHTTYSQGNFAALQTLYANAVSDCARTTGTRNGRRRALRAG